MRKNEVDYLKELEKISGIPIKKLERKSFERTEDDMEFYIQIQKIKNR